MRKKAQEKKRTLSPSSSLSNCSSSSSTSPTADSMPIMDTKERNFYDTGGLDKLAANGKKAELQEENEKGYSMDEIWNDIVLSNDDTIKPVCGGYNEEVCDFSCPTIGSPIWDYSPYSLWMTDQEESKMFLPTSEPFHSLFGQESTFLTG